ncbi:Fungal-specific transcription factor domain-containing protein [Pleurostoma richardsiae]|uniref:Fungal-specific transcription factor domain-containing protein n=1 Tax=Pleurostoma richardsiae TaxID=41990 RepID=A0AA38VQB9_9PEZI|nr:Fungal-specific transcription factor domain-containing protein [Pleurostoma richardsiae]
MADMASRVSRLEKSVAKVAEQETTTPTTVGSEAANTSHPGPSSAALLADSTSERSREDVIVQEGSSSQYFNEIILSRYIGEERNIESVLTPPQTATPTTPFPSPFNPLGILSSVSLSQPPSTFHPSKQLAVRLFKIYVDNVDGCSGLKLLHLPTDSLRIYSTIDNPPAASQENLALSFAIYFGSAVTIDAQQAHMTLGQDKEPLLLRFKIGLEQALAHGDFLDRPTLTGLRALAIYLAALRVQNRGKGIWILNGLAIRIAQSLGIHRDGERLSLSPFQSEIRRRLWWHLLSRDGRAGEDYGLEDTNSLLLVSDVRWPLNVNDSDLQPEMQRLPPEKEGWTEMTFSLANIHLAKSMQKLATIAAASSPSSPPSEDVRTDVIGKTRASIDKWLVYCNPVIPQHRLTILCSRFLLRKLDFITRLQWTMLQRPGPHADFVTEQNLVEALEILEPRFHDEDVLLEQFAWARKAYPQYHVTMYVLWHLCVKPEGPSVERAWRAVSGEMWDECTMGSGSKSAVLVALKAKALSVRDKVRRLDTSGKATGSNRDSGTASMEGASQVEGLPAFMFGGDIGGSSLDLENSADGWPDWATLVQGFQLDSPDVYWQ